MLADKLKEYSAGDRQRVISEASIEVLDAMKAGDDPLKCMVGADESLLQVLYAHAEYDLVRAYKEARDRVGFWGEPKEPEPTNRIITLN